MTKAAPQVWVLADDRAGNVNQAVGLAEALGFPFEIKKIRYNKWGRLPNIIRGASLLGMDMAESNALTAPWPDMVIGAGRKTAPIARYIKQQSGRHTKLVHIMSPQAPLVDFGVVAMPKHDNPKPSDTVVVTTGAPNRITPALLEVQRKRWEAEFSYLPSPRVAVLVGGNTKKGIFTDQHAHDLAQKASLFLYNKPGSFLVTTSRRTSDSAINVLKHDLKGKFYFYDYRKGTENPYLGYLALADAIIVTGDSISMCSEACTTGKPVYIYAPRELIPEKHQRFHLNLYAEHHARPLSGEYEQWSSKRLDDTQKLASFIKTKWDYA